MPKITTLWATSFSLLLSAGCAFSPSHTDPWGYVYGIGDAKAITKWALSQSSDRKVLDATLALTTVMRTSDDRESKNAADGYVEIYNKIDAGWPGLEFSEPPFDRGITSREEKIDELAKLCYSLLSISLSGNEGDERLVSLYYRIRPDPSRVNRYNAWQLAAAGRLAKR